MKKLALLLLIPVLLSSCGGSSVGRSESPLWHMTATADEKRTYFINQCLDFAKISELGGSKSTNQVVVMLGIE